ncbi:MAG: InlB B-repeat-containing protein, partial [Clostridia bacterium]|nr:InlB B-repeat-containing protein [Clostridia bacterium]
LIDAKTQPESNYTVKSGTRLIAAAAFSDCTALKEVIIPDSVTVIGMQAFYGCKNLAEITLPSSLTYVESDSFEGTAYYKDSSHWEDGVLYIGNCLIKANGEKLPGKYAVKSGTRLIAAGAFDEAYNPEILTVPVSLRYICKWAFNDTYVQHIYYYGTKEQWDEVSIAYSEYIDYGEGNEEFTNPDRGNNILKYAVMHYNTPFNKISFNGNGAISCSIAPITALYNSRIKLPASGAKKTGYLFTWNTKADGKGTSYTDKASTQSLTSKLGGNVTLYARWCKIYSITYKLNGGTNNKDNIKTYTQVTSTFTLKNPTRKGYTFKGWYSNKALTKKVTKITKGSTGNKVLYAKWTKTYNITYKLNGGTNNKSNPKTYTKLTSTFTLKSPTRKGYTFKGWYSNSRLTRRVLKITKGSTGNRTLYAKWRKNTYKITYKLSGGKNSAKNPSSYTVTTSTVTLKRPAKKGYTFAGWYSDSKYQNKVTVIAKGSTGNKTLYAKWKK